MPRHQKHIVKILPMVIGGGVKYPRWVRAWVFFTHRRLDQRDFLRKLLFVA
jgi:hypothetical protein